MSSKFTKTVKLQPIHTFALESYKATQETATPGRPTGTTTTEDPGSSQSRMISIVVDDLATSAPEFFMYAQEALKKLLASGVEPSDLISFSTASGNVNQPFTSDRDLLLSLAGDLHKKVQRIGTVKSECPELTDMQAQQIRNIQSGQYASSGCHRRNNSLPASRGRYPIPRKYGRTHGSFSRGATVRGKPASLSKPAQQSAAIPSFAAAFRGQEVPHPHLRRLSLGLRAL